MNCVNCQIELSPGEQFCGECGRPVEARTATPFSDPSRKCPTCAAVVAGEERFCGDCGTPLDKVPAERAQPAARTPSISAPPNPAQPRSVLRIVGVLFLALSAFLFAIAFLGHIIFSTHAWYRTTSSDLITTVMVLAICLFAFCLAALFPKIYLVYLLPSVVWLLGAVVWLFTDLSSGWGFWPDWMFATGIANLVGGVIGLVISFVLRQVKKAKPVGSIANL